MGSANANTTPAASVNDRDLMPPTDASRTPFFRRVDWSAFWTTFAVSFAAYFYTIAPTVTLEDSGELAVASDYLGVPHPPGYPIWTLLTWFFQWIFHWVRYYGQPDSNLMLMAKSLKDVFDGGGFQGHPNPAWSVGLCSAFFGALACALFAQLVSRSGADMLRSIERITRVIGIRMENLICWVAGVSGGLLFCFSPVLWSQSTIVEVYSLNAFFMVLTVLLMYRWMCRPHEDLTIFLTAFIFGLGLTNHQGLLFMAPALLTAIAFRDTKLFRDSLAAVFWLIAAVLFVIMYKMGATSTPEALREKQTLIALGLIFMAAPVGLFLIERKLMTEWKRILILAGMAGLGLSFYAYLPFSSEQNPPMNWGYPRTMEGFIHAVSRGQYEKIDVAVNMRQAIADLGFFWRMLHDVVFDPEGYVSVVVQFTWGIALFAGLALILIPGLFIYHLVCSGKPWRTALGHSAVVWLAGLAVLTILPLLFIALFTLAFPIPPPLIVILSGIPACILIIYLQRYFARDQLGTTVQWLITTYVAFHSLTVVFLLFQWPKLDVQTLFIGRVQYIQAHAVFAVWISYGLIFALAFLDTLLKGRRLPMLIGAFLVAALPVVPVLKNAYDDQFINLVGSAEQNEHDFGWQFGAWQLEGARAILSEIGEDEKAAFPNPDYPPPMTTNAIFYGGTDPGRFVPTYMIYSAHYRSDVYLITQNALADNTYMNVMRDLYGDSIWIPSQQDSNFAFQQYVEDVRAGRIAAGADVSFEGGRVSVQGVQGVMTINGILAKMIFEANRAKHDFYVEESYVIPWMYPYLTPHGLIMKINRETLSELDGDTIKNDREFWNWYVPRLINNPKFHRDVVARKTFSKLRSAIAGLYAYRRLFDESEHAFRQAIELYPLSPEANFRLADIYMQQFRFSQAREVIEKFLVGDPENDKVEEFLNQIKTLESADIRRRELEGQMASGANVEQALELADIYRRMNLIQLFESLTMNVIRQENLPPEVILRVANQYAQMNRADWLGVALERYLQKEPNNAQVWVDYAATQVLTQKPKEGILSLRRAVELGGEPVREHLRKDQRFNALREVPEFKKLVPPVQSSLPANFTLPGF